MTTVALILIGLPVVLLVYSYGVYPALLWVAGRFVSPPRPWGDWAPQWPLISISLPAYNEEQSIRGTIENLLALDYPEDRRQIVIVSDASTDGTDDVVRQYAARGVELLRLPERSGKTGAENAAGPLLRGEIVVNTDATIRILPHSLKALIRAFQDPTIGAASGRDVSVGDIHTDANRGESGYVGYEMVVRALETRLGGIVGASGCFYAIRRPLHHTLFPGALSRDFASALICLENGRRAVSVDEAACLVPRARSLQAEYRRKVRTMARGLDTLWYKRSLLNPFRYGRFAWMLFSHKLARWLVFLTVPGSVLGFALLAVGGSPWGLAGLGGALVLSTAGVMALRWPEGRKTPRVLAVCGFVFATHLAGALAWIKALRGERNPIWEPTRRPV